MSNANSQSNKGQHPVRGVNRTSMDMPKHDETKFQKIMDDVTYEWAGASAKFAPMNSAHEGFAVLKGEVDELWEVVRGKQGMRSAEDLRAEAVQVAAMAIRFIYDICDGKEQV